MKFALALIVLCAAVSAQYGGSGGIVHDRLGSSLYHYSWRHAGPNVKLTWNEALYYCQSLPGGYNWLPVSINSAQENYLITNAIASDNVHYIWTGGVRSGYNSFRWLVGPFRFQAWSYTGGEHRPQPDNREGNEDCLAILNNFYKDGIVWHDVACHHRKPVACEANLGGNYGIY